MLGSFKSVGFRSESVLVGWRSVETLVGDWIGLDQSSDSFGGWLITCGSLANILWRSSGSVIGDVSGGVIATCCFKVFVFGLISSSLGIVVS